MDTHDLISLVLGAVSLPLAVYALVLQKLDRPRLKIRNVTPGISGSKAGNEQQWQSVITALEMEVENVGSRPAVRCEAVALFAGAEPLPLYAQRRDHTAGVDSREFTVEAKTKVRLVGGWGLRPDGVLTQKGPEPSEFLKYLPATIEIKVGRHTVRFVYTVEAARERIEAHRRQQYLRS